MLALFFMAVTFMFLGQPAYAVQNPAVRAQTVQALQAIKQDRWDVGRSLIASARDPLAAKLYFWLSFTEKRGEYSYTKHVRFIQKNPEWPGLGELSLRIEKTMPSNLSAAEVLGWFERHPPKTTQGIDRYIEALIIHGKKDQVLAYLSRWWAKTSLSRAEQKQIYGKYSAYITRDAHKARFDSLLFKGQNSNARAVARVLGQGYPQLAEARIALAAKKSNVNGLINKVPAALQQDSGLQYERLRWRRRNKLNSGAIEILRAAPAADNIQNPKDWWRERHIMIRRLLEEKKYRGAYLLASDHRQSEGFSYAQAEWIAGWLALSFLNDAPAALAHFEAVNGKVKTPVSRARAAYWAGRAAKKLGQKEASRKWFKAAGQYQTVFYGQMAGAELGLASALAHARAPKVSPAQTQVFRDNELIQSAQLLRDAGMRREASRFIQAFIAQNQIPEAYKFSAEIAAGMEHHHDALRIAKEASKKGLFLTAQAYPTLVDKLRGTSIEWALVHGIMRQESMFDLEARSPVGARGLMQLMPATAKGVARSLGVAHQTEWLTSRPAHNILLGTQYLNDLIVRYGGSYPLAIAAYNAGPGRVDRWLKIFGDPRFGQVDMIDWIELIPIYETRNYVQRVMEAIYVYRIRLKGIQAVPQEAIHIAMRYR